jgi:hypothetical protein
MGLKWKGMGIDDWLFYLGVIFIPFDNLFFAPSAGWATIAPIIFLVYLLFNVRYIRLRKETLWLITAVFVLTLFNYIFYPPTADTIFDSLSTGGLGVAFYFSIYIFFIEKERDPKLFLKLLFIVYTISFFYGILDSFNIPFVAKVMSFLEKRDYPRLQFTFTESSFIPMHIYGVLLPIIFIFRKYREEVKNLAILALFFVITSAILGGSTRFYVDTVVVVFIAFVCVFFNGKITKKKWIFLGVACVAAIGVFFVLLQIPRIHNVIQLGVYGDASLACRWFRINAILKGMLQNPLRFLFGYGMSNTYYPFNAGYDGALAEYINAYRAEVEDLKGVVTTSFFCGHLRLLADFGAVVYVPFMAMLFTKRRKSLLRGIFFWVLVYLYVQFDSYAFYTIWLYLFFYEYERHQSGEDRLLKEPEWSWYHVITNYISNLYANIKVKIEKIFTQKKEALR